VNCAALPEQLLESELFGHERGAFTGATQRKPGQIEVAAGGTLLLDEVSEMSLSAQVKFLRVLQEREFQRLGGTRPIKSNVRIVAATNRDLSRAMERGDFREDLYYRLQVFEIRLPPLRERPEDVLPLTAAFLDDIGRSFGRAPAGITREAKERLMEQPWRGNARELRNVLERAAIVSDGGLITPEHLALDARPESTAVAPTNLKVLERQMIERALRETRGNKTRAALRLGLTRKQLYVRLQQYGLE
jgi:DNA-binding NtrC family response regulator